MRISINTASSGSGRVDDIKSHPQGELRGATKLVKYLTIILLLAIRHLIHAKSELTADESIPIPKVEIDAKGNLQITASPTSSASDFDFLVENGRCTTGTSTRDSKIVRNGRNSTPRMRTQESSAAPAIWILIPRQGCGVCTGSRATPGRSIRRWWVHLKMVSDISSGMLGTRNVRSGVRRFQPTTARLGNGISLTFRKDLRSSQLESQLILFSLG